MNQIAQFNIGDLVIHKHSRYRAIVVDVDPLFQASGRYNPQAKNVNLLRAILGTGY